MKIDKSKLIGTHFLVTEKKHNIVPKKMMLMLDEYDLDVCEDCGVILEAKAFKDVSFGHAVCDNCKADKKVLLLGAGRKINEGLSIKSLLDHKGIEYKTYAFNQSYFWTSREGELIFGSPFEYTNYNNCGHELIPFEEFMAAVESL